MRRLIHDILRVLLAGALVLALTAAECLAGNGSEGVITISPGIGPKFVGWLAWLLALIGLKKARARGD